MITEKEILKILTRKDKIRHPEDVAKDIYIAFRTFTGSKWLLFDLMPRRNGLKTDRWLVYNKDAEIQIGEIKWYGPFRAYSFFPKNDCVFESTCLQDITNFIQHQMREWGKERHLAAGS